MNTKTLILIMFLLTTTTVPVLAEDFSTLDGVPAEAMSHGELATVEGKFFEYNPIIGWLWVNEYGHIWHWTTGTYIGQRQMPRQLTLSDIHNAFPDSYRPSGPGTTRTSIFFRQNIYTGLAGLLN